MKKYLLLALASASLLGACSKGADPTPAASLSTTSTPTSPNATSLAGEWQVDSSFYESPAGARSKVELHAGQRLSATLTQTEYKLFTAGVLSKAFTFELVGKVLHRASQPDADLTIQTLSAHRLHLATAPDPASGQRSVVTYTR